MNQQTLPTSIMPVHNSTDNLSNVLVSDCQGKPIPQAFLEAVTDLIFIINYQGICVDYIPPRDQHAYIPAAAFIGNHLMDTLPAEIAEHIIQFMHIALATNQLHSFDFEFHQEDGQLNFYEGRIIPTKPHEVLCVIKDVTQIIAAEEALQKSKAYYQNLIASSPIPVLLHNKTGDILFANKAMLNTLNIACLDQLLSKDIYDLLHKKHWKKAKNVLKRGFQDKLPSESMLFDIVSNSQHSITFEVAGNIINYGGELIVQITVKDVLTPIKKNPPNKRKKINKSYSF